MAKYHINPKSGEPGKCSATKGGCPFGDDADHFTSIEAARTESEKVLAEANGWEVNRRAIVTPEVTKLMAEIIQFENNPARHRYGFPEDEMVRYNIDQAIKTRKDELKKLIPLADFTVLQASITSDDTGYGVEQTAIRLGNTDKKFSWDRVMGDTRRTAKAIKSYEGARNGAVASNPEFQDEITNLAKKHRDNEIFARAFESKYEIPKQYELAFEKAWADKKTGEKYLTSELARLQADKKEYTEGRLSATKVVGTGLRNPKAAADEYFAKRDRELTRAIKTRGRSYSVTVSNVMYKARQEKWPYSN